MNRGTLSTPLYTVCIPSLKKELTEDDIRNQFYWNKIGEVSYVDFYEPEELTGIIGRHSANVYFLKLYDSYYTSEIHRTLTETTRSWKMRIRSGENYWLDDYWFISKTDNPIPRTVLNIHQVVDKFSKLEEDVAKSHLDIAQMNLKINKLTQDLKSEASSTMAMRLTLVQMFGPTFEEKYYKNLKDQLLVEAFLPQKDDGYECYSPSSTLPDDYISGDEESDKQFIESIVKLAISEDDN